MRIQWIRAPASRTRVVPEPCSPAPAIGGPSPTSSRSHREECARRWAAMRSQLRAAVATGFVLAGAASANTGYEPLPLSQNWSNTALITVDDNWSQVPGIIGYGGNAVVVDPGVDPQTILTDLTPATPDVTANRTNPNLVYSGVVEFHLA